LIDDALSALDAYVGKKIMDGVFCGELAGKTRVMVTHHLSLLEGNVNKVILLSNGKIIQSGKFEDVKKTKEYQDFASSANDEKEGKSNDQINGETNQLVKDSNTEDMAIEKINENKAKVLNQNLRLNASKNFTEQDIDSILSSDYMPSIMVQEAC
jgi:ABC-type multidrug transport system ATPase subunit